jgi:addiction module HigA family antidote
MSMNRLPPLHPGAFLAETLGELSITQAQFARLIAVSRMRISHVVNGTRPITAELALRIGRALDQSPQYWLNLQTAYDLRTAQESIGKELRSIRAIKAARAA